MRLCFKYPDLDLKEKELYYRKHSSSWQGIHINISKIIPTEKKDKIMFIRLMNTNLSDFEGDILWFSSDDILIMHHKKHTINEQLDNTLKSLETYSEDSVTTATVTISNANNNFDNIIAHCIDAHSKELAKRKKNNKDPAEDINIKIDAMTFLSNKGLRSYRRKPAILIVEDDNVMMSLIKETVKDAGDIIIADNLTKAARLYERMAPDIVLLDINLPDGNGTDLLQEISKADKNHHVIAITGDTNIETISKCKAYKAKAYIAKPFTSERLLSTIKKFKK